MLSSKLPDKTKQGNESVHHSNCQLVSIASHADKEDRKKAPVGLRRLICLNMLVCGIELCASAGFTYVPPMLLKAGFSETSMTCLMGIGPFLALLTVPFLGRWSDQCRSRYGRRRPFILGISVLVITALILIPYGPLGGTSSAHPTVGPKLKPSFWHYILMALGVVLLDYGCHASFNPCEALLSDTVKNTQGKERGFIVYSNMVSLGGSIGYLITALDWSTFGVTSVFGGQEQAAFGVLLVLFVVALLTTLLGAKENTLRQLTASPPALPHLRLSELAGSETRSLSDASIGIHHPVGFATKMKLNMGNALHLVQPKMINDEIQVLGCDDGGYETSSNNSQEDVGVSVSVSPPSSVIAPGAQSYFGEREVHSPPRVSYRMWLGRSCDSFCITIAALSDLRIPLCLVRRCVTSLPVALCRWVRGMTCSFRHVPLVLRRLFVADFCSWTALMCHNMFYTDYVGQGLYGGNPNGDSDSVARQLYDSGVRMGSWGLLLHSCTAILYATFLQRFVMHRYGMSHAYFLGLLTFSTCMMITLFTNNLILVNLCSAISGLGFAAITTIPNLLITAYHSNKEIYFERHVGYAQDSDARSRAEDAVIDDVSDDDDDEKEGAGGRGLGADIAVIDSAYYLSQICLSLLVGTVVDLMHSVAPYIAISACFGLLGCYFSTKVIFTPSDMVLARSHANKF